MHFVCPFQIRNDLTTEEVVQCLAVVAFFAMSWFCHATLYVLSTEFGSYFAKEELTL